MRFLHFLTEDLTKLSNDHKFVKIEGILSEIQNLQSPYFLLFSLYLHYFVHYLRINLAGKMYLLLNWVTYFHAAVYAVSPVDAKVEYNLTV